MSAVAEVFLRPSNTLYKVPFVTHSAKPIAFQACAKAIRAGEYRSDYDYNYDGYLTPDDYNIMYDLCYRLWDAWHDITQNPYGVEAADIRALVRVKRISVGDMPFDPMFDFDGDGFITDTDIAIIKYWLLVGKPERDTFDDL